MRESEKKKRKSEGKNKQRKDRVFVAPARPNEQILKKRFLISRYILVFLVEKDLNAMNQLLKSAESYRAPEFRLFAIVCLGDLGVMTSVSNGPDWQLPPIPLQPDHSFFFFSLSLQPKECTPIFALQSDIIFIIKALLSDIKCLQW